jgi:DHA2 family multidrug resistance protein
MNDSSTSISSLSRMALFMLILGMGMGVFVDVLDTSIANVALPYIAATFGVTPAEGTWVITSYAITNAIVIPLTGRLAYRFDESRLFIGSMILFTISSLLCGLSWNLASLIFFRLLQGAAGGALLPLSQSLVIQVIPEKHQGVAMGGLFALIIVAPVLGPILGGWVTDSFSWQWIFLINVPIGIISIALLWHGLGFGLRKIAHKKYDFSGFFLLALMVGMIQMFLDRGYDLGWFASYKIQIMALAALVASLLFIAWNIYSDDPLVDLSFLGNRNFAVGTFITSFGFACIFGGTVILPLWLQTQLGYSAMMAGLSVAPLGFAPLILTPFIGYVMTKIDNRLLVTGAGLIFSSTFFWFATFNNEVSLTQLMISRAVQGIGIALFALPMATITLSEVPKEKYTSAAGLFHFIRIFITCGFGTSVFATFWQSWGGYYHNQLMESVSSFNMPTQQFLGQLEGYGASEQLSAVVANAIVSREAILLSTNDLFWISGWVTLMIVPLIWTCRYKPTEGLTYH